MLSRIFISRIQAVESLRALSAGLTVAPEELGRISSRLDEASIQFEHASTSTAYGALAGLIRLVASLTEWRKSVLDASEGADRIFRSTVERYRMWHREYGEQEAAEPFLDAAGLIPKICSLPDFEDLCKALATTPLPVGAFSDGRYRIPRNSNQQVTEPAPAELSIAFLKFQIDGEAAATIHHLAPSVLHDLEIEVRVSRWPDSATKLRLSPVSAELLNTYELSEFTFDRPDGPPPYSLVQRGRAVLKHAQGLNARPYEFKYAASFQPTNSEQPVSVVGHRTLLIEGFDVKSNPITGYPSIDEKILEVRDKLRRSGAVKSEELTALLEVLTVLGSLAGRAVQDAEFDGAWKEAEFQRVVRAELRRNPRIGSHLDEHPAAAGGITDLSFRGIAIELKSIPNGVKTLADCQTYVEQTASYAVAKEKQVAVLCVLDCSKKTVAPFPAKDGITILKSEAPAGVSVVTIIIQGNITRPARLSR